MDLIYLDNNATTLMLPEVADAIAECHGCVGANPASQHRQGRLARKLLEEAREGIAEILGAQLGIERGDRLLFTSGGTESNNLAVRGIVGSRPGEIIVSAVEHPSISAVVNACVRSNQSVCRLSVDTSGRISPEELDERLSPTTRLVSVMAGNHETGVLQPLTEIAARCSDASVPLHTDAVQMVGKLPVHFHRLGVAAMTFSAHKFHGPVGIGGLLLRGDIDLDPILFGGSQQMGMRPGTEPVALAVGMFRALCIWQRDAQGREQRMTMLRDRFERLLAARIGEFVIHGATAPRLPHTSSLAFPGLDRQAMVMALDLAGVACSTGSACVSGSSQPSFVIQAMHASPPVVEGSLRFSLSALTTEADIEEAVIRIIKVHKKLREVSERRKTPSPPPQR